MAYTNVWSSTTPLGTIQANTLDDEIRKVRLDFEERLKDIFAMSSGQMVADPIQPQNLTLADLLTAARGSFSGNVSVAGTLTVGTISLSNTVGVAQFTRLGSDLVFSGSQSLGLSFSQPVSTVYEYEWVVVFTNTGSSGNTSFLISCPAGAVGVFGGIGISGASAVPSGTGRSGAVGGSQVLINNNGSTFPSLAIFKAVVVTDGSHAGTVDLVGSPSAGTTTVVANSLLKYTKVA